MQMGQAKRKPLILVEQIEPRILVIRGQRVILDADLAKLYGTTTKALNQAVKRNPGRFPADFRFQLNTAEKGEVVTICDHLAFLPGCEAKHEIRREPVGVAFHLLIENLRRYAIKPRQVGIQNDPLPADL